MAESHGLLSDQWHLVEGLRVALRPDCPARRQEFRGRLWHVISDPYSNRHFRLRPEAWRFVARLDRRLTVDECWRALLAEDPAAAPGQREVTELLSQLHGANLLVSDSAIETWSMIERRRRERQRTARQQALNFLFLRIPLFDPDPVLEKLRGVGRVLLGPVGLVIWAITLIAGAKAVIEHWGLLREQTQGVLAPTNLVWLYLTWALVKVFHELGHGMMTKRFGGEVRSCGVMLLVFTPVPFVDASAAWTFRARYQRLLVGAAGMIFELLLAAIAALVWARTGGEGAVGQVAYNVMFLASISTVLFNANPLLRFDGYYLMADWVGVPNLHQQAARQWRRWFERLGLGIDGPSPVSPTRQGAAGLGLYGAASAVYRVFVLLVIVAFIAGQLFEVGLVLAVLGLILWLGGPIGKFYRYLATDARVQEARCRSWLWGIFAPVVVLTVLLVVPMPHALRAPGVIEGSRTTDVFAGAPGRIAQLPVASGQTVARGDLLVRLANPDLADRQHELEALHREVEVRRRSAWSRLPAVIEPLEQRLHSIDAQLRENTVRQAALEVTAAQSGTWSSPGLEWREGSEVPRGALLGRLQGDGSLRFRAVVRGRDVDRLDRSQRRKGEVRLRGAAGESIPVTLDDLRPAESRRLPSAALGWRAGGEVPTDAADTEGLTAVDPFYILEATLPPGTAPELYLRTGVLRVALDPKPWGAQAWRRFRQFVQERYGR